MTEPVDDMLTAAGRRWRAAQPEPPEPDLARWSQEAPRTRRWGPAVAAAAATVAAVSATVLLVHGRADPDRPDLTDPVAAAAASALVVREGDTVQASGTVLAAPGSAVRFCAPAPQPLGSTGEAGTGCAYFVPVTGVDLSALTGATDRNGIRQGSAHLVGVWRAGELVVTRQDPPQEQAPEPGPSDSAPCPPPAGGWKSDPDNKWADPAYAAALNNYVERQHPEQFRRPWAAHQQGARILVVEVVEGDVNNARTELEQRYDGNLCVVGQPGRPSIADQHKILSTVGRAVSGLMNNPANGIFTSVNDDTVQPAMVMLTPELYDQFAKLGFAALEPNPWLRPVP
jgi:hypothetical protein